MAISLKIDEKLKDRIQHLAEMRQRSSHWIMLEAICDYVEREEALDAWTHYQETGQHVTGQELQDWLKT